MRLAPGTRIGSYEVIDGLGAGGMGEVYRARDAVLHREIALKLVHPDYCHNPESMVRLRREARVLAALNHPNVATLHELAEFGDSCGLVMELVNGDTLAELLRRRPLKIDEALQLATQIAAALEAAHERGIIHRDLKPANIKVTPEGSVKVLDFGLAKAIEAGPEAAASTLVTVEGVVMGTAPYMSPEQARGADLDRRTDVWAFGCVLYEMLTRRLAFDGNSRSDIVVAILEKEPDWSLLPPETPLSIRRLLRRCLQKDVRRRFRDMGDVRLELEDATLGERPSDAMASASSTGSSVSYRQGAWRYLSVFALGALLGGVAVVAWAGRPASSPTVNEVRFAVTLPDAEHLAATELGGLAMRPDGRAIVYVSTRGATTQLLVRSFDGVAARVLQGTFGAVSPFFAPDGDWVGFFADGKLKKVPITGGAPVTICDAPDGLGGSWSSSGMIVFASATGAPLQQVPAGGGDVTRATELDVSRGEFSHRWPEFLPDGETVLFTVGTVGEWDEAEIVAQSLHGGARTTILKGGTNPRYLASGHLAYAHDGAIWAASFDARKLALVGTPVRVLEGVSTSADGAAQFAVSRAGTAAYHPSAPLLLRRLVVVDGDTQTPLAAAPHAYVTPRVSPDGKRVLLGVSDSTEHVWSYDLSAGTLTQLTFEAANRSPVWSADATRVTFASNRNGAFNLFSELADAMGPAERLTTTDSLQLPGSWSPDGERLAFMEQHSATGRDVWLMRRNGERVAIANSQAEESAPRVSPDGRWIAYVSNESGSSEVYLRPMDGGTARKLSTGGGTEPVWRPDGRAVYFRDAGRLLLVPVGGGATRVVFAGAAETGTIDAAGYDVIGPDRFLVLKSASGGGAPSDLRMILNWSPAPTFSSR